MSLCGNCLVFLLPMELLQLEVQKPLAFAWTVGHFGNEVAASAVVSGTGDGAFPSV
jgi:hypothetical protein